MARATYDEIAELIKKEYPKFIVCPPVEDDMALTVYPPESYYDDHGVDVFLSGNTAEFWIDGFKARKITGTSNASVLATSIISELEAIQTERAKEFAE